MIQCADCLFHSCDLICLSGGNCKGYCSILKKNRCGGEKPCKDLKIWYNKNINLEEVPIMYDFKFQTPFEKFKGSPLTDEVLNSILEYQRYIETIIEQSKWTNITGKSPISWLILRIRSEFKILINLFDDVKVQKLKFESQQKLDDNLLTMLRLEKSSIKNIIERG